MPLYFVGIYIRTWWRVAYKNENKDQGQISSFLSVVCGPMPSCFVLCIGLVFEGNVVKRRISK